MSDSMRECEGACVDHGGHRGKEKDMESGLHMVDPDDFQTPKTASAPRSSHCSTASDVVHAWMRGECEYPGDSYMIWAMDEYMREHIRQRHYGMDVLASAELDNAVQLLAAIRFHFSL